MKLGKRQNLYEWLKRGTTGRGAREHPGNGLCYVPMWLLVTQVFCGQKNRQECVRPGLIPVGKIPRRRACNSLQYSPHEQRSLAGYAFHVVPKSQSRLSDYGHVKLLELHTSDRSLLHENYPHEKKDLNLNT